MPMRNVLSSPDFSLVCNYYNHFRLSREGIIDDDEEPHSVALVIIIIIIISIIPMRERQNCL